jgi:hypothetical protein
LKKPAGSVRFYKPKTEPRPKKNKKKTEPNRQKTEPNQKNQAKPVWTGFVLKTEPNRNRSVWTGFGFFKKNSVWLLFYFIKTEPNRKWSPLAYRVVMLLWLFVKVFCIYKYIKIIFFIFKKLFLILTHYDLKTL